MGPMKVEGNQDQNSANDVYQMIDKNGSNYAEGFLNSGNFHFIKTERIDECNNEENKYYINDRIKMNDNLPIGTSSIASNSIKTETNDEENKYNLNQMLNENDDMWHKLTSSVACNFQRIKQESSEHFDVTESTTRYQDTHEVLFLEQSDQSPEIGHLPANKHFTRSKVLGTHKCDKCEYTSLHKHFLLAHMKDVHMVLKNRKCKMYDNTASSKKRVRQNIKSTQIKEKKIRSYECKFCDFNSSANSVLQAHIEAVHLNIKNYKCDLCHYTSSTRRYLQQHMKSVHFKLKNHKCDICDYTTSSNCKLKAHINSVHLKQRNYKCNMCEYSSSWKLVLQRHIDSIHLKQRNYRCDICDYSSSRKQSLQVHINSVHLKQIDHKCDICDYSSPWKENLQKHINSVHLKQRNYKCDQCNCSLSCKQNLQNHINSVHSKQRNFKCDMCDFSSSQKANLQRHINSVHLY